MMKGNAEESKASWQNDALMRMAGEVGLRVVCFFGRCSFVLELL